MAIRFPGLSSNSLGARLIYFRIFAKAHASYCIIIGPLIFTPLKTLIKCLSALGSGCPMRMYQRWAIPVFGAFLVHEMNLRRIVLNEALDKA
jgi:hypothetical protein